MPLSVKTYQQFLSDVVTTWASKAEFIVNGQIVKLSPNLPSGDPLLAIFQAHVLCGLMFIQSQIVRVNKMSRAETATGADLDSFYADFDLPRKPATKAKGQVQFSLRSVITSDILIEPGKIVQTTDGSIQYQVVADTLQEAWSVSDNAYILPGGSLSINVTVEALEEGSASNVQPGALSQMVSSIAGVSFVTNLGEIENGTDPEEDPPFRDRFKLMIKSINAKATPPGILKAALDTVGVKTARFLENQDISGNFQPGYGLLVIDDGSGDPPDELLAAVTQNVEPSRGNFTQITSIRSTKETVDIDLNVRINPLASPPSDVVRAVGIAIINYVNSLEIGDPLYLENLGTVAKNAHPMVISAQPGSKFINGEAADLIVNNKTTIRTDNAHVTIGTY